MSNEQAESSYQPRSIRVNVTLRESEDEIEQASFSLQDTCSHQSICSCNCGANGSKDSAEILRLRAQICDLESENTDLKRLKKAMPRLKNTQGKDYAIELAYAFSEAEEYKQKFEEKQEDYAKLMREYSSYKTKVAAEILAYRTEMAETQKRATALEEANKQLNDLLEDERSRAFEIENGMMGNRLANLAEICQQMYEQLMGTAETLSGLLNTMGASDEVADFIRRLNEIKLDFNKSLEQCRRLHNETKTLARLSNPSSLQNSVDSQEIGAAAAAVEVAEHSGDGQPPRAESAATRESSNSPVVDNQQQQQAPRCDACVSWKAQCETVRNQLNNELRNKEVLIGRFQDKETELEETKDQLEQLRAKLEEIIAEKVKLDKLVQAKKDRSRDKDLDAQNDLIERLRQQNLELDARNDELAQANRELDEKGDQYLQSALQLKEEMDKDLEEKTTQIVYLEQALHDLRTRAEGFEDRYISEKESRESIDREYQTAVAELDQCRAELAADRTKARELWKHIQTYTTLVLKGNEVLEKKIHEGEQEQAAGTRDSSNKQRTQQTAPITSDDPFGQLTSKDQNSDIRNHTDFLEFLADCQKKVNRIVQLLKKSQEELATAENTTIPYFDDLLSEARSVRLMLYKLHKYVKSNSICIDGIRGELTKIYQTLNGPRKAKSGTGLAQQNGPNRISAA